MRERIIEWIENAAWRVMIIAAALLLCGAILQAAWGW